MRDVDANEHSLVLLDERQALRVHRLIVTAELEVELERDVGKVLRLTTIRRELLPYDAHRVDAVFRVA